jgi:hypothetical protein
MLKDVSAGQPINLGLLKQSLPQKLQMLRSWLLGLGR